MKESMENQSNSHWKFSIAYLLAFAFCLSIGCSNALSKESKPDHPANTGSMAVSIPSVAAWLQPSQKKANEINEAQSSSTRAMAYATSVKIEVLNSSGTAVIDPVTFTTSGISPGSNASQTINNIPVGTNYTVKASVYNSHVSTTSPVVSGQATGVTITDGATTSVSIHCLPVSPESLTLDVAANASLAIYAEKWYSISVVSGTHYYFTQTDVNVIMGLFNSSGTYISSGYGYIDYTATYSGTLYAAVVAYAAASSVLTVSTTAPVLNEGSSTAPFVLTPNSAHIFKAGPYNSQDTSYYSFTTTTAGTYALDTVQGDYYAALYSNSGFSTLVTSGSMSIGLVFTSLSASTYYLKIQNYDDALMSLSGQIVDPTVIGANTDGSVASPVALTLDTAWSGKAGAKVYNANSYYKFTTGSGNDYNIVLSSIAPTLSYYISAYIYSTASFSSQLSSFSTASSSGGSVKLLLAASTTYYIKIANIINNGAITYSLKVEALAAPTFNSLPADGTWTSGSISSSGNSQWYVATVTGGQSYNLNWDDSLDGGGSYTLDVKVSAYQADRFTTYFTNWDSGYSSGNTRVLSVPAGQSLIYILVQPYTNGNTGTYALKMAPKPPSGGLAITID